MVAKKIFGLDISDHSIEAVLLTGQRFGKPRVQAYARTLVKTGAIVNGEIKQPNVVAAQIQKTLASAKPQPITSSYCVISLPEAQVFTAVFKFPAGLRRTEIQNTIPFKAEEVTPFQSADIYFDFKTVGRAGGTQDVYYVAVPKKIVDGYIATLQAAGLTPLACDVESVSLSRALFDTVVFAKNSAAAPAVLMLDIGAHTTIAAVFDRSGIRQSVSFKIAGNRFTKKIATGLKVPEKKAEELKMAVGFDVSQKQPKVVSLLEQELKSLLVDVKKSVAGYETETKQRIGAVVLAGGSSLLPGIEGAVNKGLGLPVMVGDALAKVEDPKRLVAFKNKSVLFATVIGLALRAIQPDPANGALNLLPATAPGWRVLPAPDHHRAWRRVYRGATLLIVLALGLTGLVFARQRYDFDPYRLVVPAPQPSTGAILIDQQVLDEIRRQFLLPPTSTPTTTDPFATGSATSTPTTTASSTTVYAKIVQTTIGTLNLRKGPGSEFDLIGQVKSGNQYPLLEESGQWYKIKVDVATVGWVSSLYAKKVTSTETINQQPTSPAPVKVTGPRVKILSTSLGYLNVRQGPGTDYPKVGEAKIGLEYPLLGQQADWYQIQLSSTVKGWVSSVYAQKLP